MDAVLAPPPAPDLDALVGELARLSRGHLLLFRIEVGRVVAQALAARDPAGHPTVDPRALRRLIAERGGQLADLGLSEATLRQSLLAWDVVRGLPRDLVGRLLFSHVVELARVGDYRTRRLLAERTVEEGWTGRALREAVLAALTDGREPAPLPAPAPARVVSRLERSAAAIDALVAQWESVPPEHLTDAHRSRAREAVARLRERLAAVEARFAG